MEIDRTTLETLATFAKQAQAYDEDPQVRRAVLGAEEALQADTLASFPVSPEQPTLFDPAPFEV